jgi:hypothetical protein
MGAGCGGGPQLDTGKKREPRAWREARKGQIDPKLMD